MSKTKLRSLIRYRARILAMVQFTSRPDLHASDFPEDGGLDLMVRIGVDGPGYQKFFGVQLRGTNRKISNPVQADRFMARVNLKR